jgi:hypothetical protein
MQVNEQNNFVTHAVIGGGVTQEMGISSTAEFFNILASTLYTNQRLAVVREVLCNAWDAHKDAGIRDTPIEITLTPTKMVIRDFGKGIPDDLILPIYGIFGQSTKKSDGNQTGGFGLGSKAPFAYTDNFEVTSHHNGVKTLYAISRSNASVSTKPGITPILSIPTTETGVEVSIVIKSLSDYHVMLGHINNVTFMGNMCVRLNNEILPVLGVPSPDLGMHVIIQNDSNVPLAKVNVLYGDVLYPVTSDPTIADELRALEKASSTVRHAARPASFVLLAPPHSITVTPSRESLSNVKNTLDTLKKIMKDALDRIAEIATRSLEPLFVEVVEIAKAVAVASGSAKALLDLQSRLPYFACESYINSAESLHRNYAVGRGFTVPASLRIQAAVDTGFIKSRDAKMFLQMHYSKASRNQTGIRRNSWRALHVIRPLVSRMLKNANLDVRRCGIFNSQGIDYYNHYTKNVPLISDNHCREHRWDAALLTRRVYISNIGTQLTVHKSGLSSAYLTYHITTKKDNYQAAADFFEKMGYTVIDGRVTLPKRVTTSTQVNRAKTGEVHPLPAKYMDLRNLRLDRAEVAKLRENKPSSNFDWVVLVKPHQNISISNGLYFAYEHPELSKLMGTRGGVVFSDKRFSDLRNAGAHTPHSFLAEQLTKEILADNRLPDIHATIEALDKNTVLRYSRVNPTIIKGMWPSLVITNYQHLLLTLLRKSELRSQFIADFLSTGKCNQSVEVFLKKLKECPYADLLSWSNFFDDSAKPARIAAVKKLLDFTLNLT